LPTLSGDKEYIMFIDQAIRNFPEFERMDLQEARDAYCKWADKYWDFTAKREHYKHTICNDITSVRQIAAMAWAAAEKGNDIKNKIRK